jgi:PIN domain nuclease of toxin-antitoxin system
VLLDSHAALWWLADDRALGRQTRAVLERADEAYFSVITPWELGIKSALGKVTMPDGLSAALTASGFRALGVSLDHAELAPALPAHHRDPFDRMLVAQAQLEVLSLVTADAAIGAYDVEVIDARR